MLKLAIPFIDLRDKTPVDLIRAYPDKARALVQGAASTWGGVSRTLSLLALPLADRRSRAWLKRTHNPYLYEIESMADVYHSPGLYALNLSYEWGCTTGVFREESHVPMLRVLDWPFPNLGQHVVVALQKGPAGEFYNVTWPGFSGVLNAMAPKRFSVALNMAPMRSHGHSLVRDWVKNRRLASQEYGLPPSHLLRMVCDKATGYAEAKQWLMSRPLAVPAIFIIGGTKLGEGCIIERIENDVRVIELGVDLRVTAANHFVSEFNYTGKGYRPREPDSAGRYRQCEDILAHHLEAEDFSWLQAPIINRFTRLCMISDAYTQRLLVQGFEGNTAVTGLFSLPGTKIHVEEATWS